MSEHGIPSGGFAPEGALVKWLTADLEAAAANRANRPWIVVAGHRPIYDTGHCDPSGAPTGDNAKLQAAIEDLLCVVCPWGGPSITVIPQQAHTPPTHTPTPTYKPDLL